MSASVPPERGGTRLSLYSTAIALFVVAALGCASSGSSEPADGAAGHSEGGGGGKSGVDPAGGTSGAKGGQGGGPAGMGSGGRGDAGTTGSGGSPATGGTAGSRGSTGGTGGVTGGGGSGLGGGSGQPGAGGGGAAGMGSGGRGGAGTAGRGGSPATGGTAGSRGGTGGTGGVTGNGGSGPGGSAPAGSCGATPNPLPFNCRFAWGVNGSNPNTSNYVQFISNWAGYNIQSNGTFSSCDQCGWLTSTMANVPQVPALIAYLIGYYGHALGYQDGNVSPNGPNLTNSMGPVLLGVDNASCPSGVICASNLMVKAYATYAAQLYASYKKPILWLMEGDFVQYSIEGSSTGLSYDQLGQLAAQITNAVKCNDPSAIIAWNYSTWISTTQRDSYFNAINSNVAKLGTSYEMVFTTGSGSSASAGTGTTWAQLYTAAGNKPIYSDESFGLSAASDSWANQSAATIDARIAGHVVAVNITTSTPSYLQTNLTTTLAPAALNTTCF
jgi:hypothetical protein